MPEAQHSTHALPIDSLPVDTLPTDTLTGLNPAQMHIVLDRPEAPAPRGNEIHDYSSATSWVILGLVTLFLLISVRFRHNLRFTGSMFRELIDAPSTGNIFGDTMRETTFTALLNLLCIASSGLLLWQCVGAWALPSVLAGPGMLTHIGLCMLCTLTLYIAQRFAYFCIGRIFFTPLLTRLWLRAFSASQSALSFVLMPLALLTLFYPATLDALLIPALIAWILARLMFIIKSYRIFSPQGVGFLGFLYYLCGVEIIPVVITCAAAISLCHS